MIKIGQTRVGCQEEFTDLFKSYTIAELVNPDMSLMLQGQRKKNQDGENIMLLNHLVLQEKESYFHVL